MNPTSTRPIDAPPPAGDVQSAPGDWRFEALLAAGALAWAGTALGTPCPPEGQAAAPPAGPALTQDDVERWARRGAEQGQELLAAGRERLVGLWDRARLAAWGEEVEPHEPRLAVYGAGVERDHAAGAAWRAWAADDAGPGASVVVLVHGLDESGEIWSDLAPALAAAGRTVVRFDYPNDQAIATTTDQLAAALVGLGATGTSRVDLVGHSMGGLVARDLLTRAEFYGGDAAGGLRPAGRLPAVGRLVMLATPNQGSPLASLLPLSEAREHLERRAAGSPSPGDGWIHSTRDGRGEAGDDLAEGSAFLTELNARPEPRGVKITNVVARVVSVSERERLRSAIGRGLAELLDPEAARAVNRTLDDALDGLGDGLVGVDSMRLEGVEDTVEVKGNHRSMIRRMGPAWLRHDPDAPPPAVPIIVNRLGEQPGE